MMHTDAIVTVTYHFNDGESLSVTVSARGYPDAIDDARVQATRGLIECVRDLSDIVGDDYPSQADHAADE